MAESASTLFPDFSLGLDLVGDDAFATSVIRAFNGREQRRARISNLPKWAGTTPPLTAAQQKTLRDFFVARSGMLGAFYFWRPIPEDVTAYACGSVSAASTFTVPIKGQWWAAFGPATAVTATYSAVYVGGVSKAFTVTANVGTYGEDRITFNAGAQTGAVTVDATGARLRKVARFGSDELRRALMQPNAASLLSIPIVIQELYG